MKVLKFLVAAAIVNVFSLTALSSQTLADQCDYIGRHYKTDVTVVGGRTFPASRSGDILISPSVLLTVRNVGVSEFSSPGGIVNARRVAVTMKGQTFYGFLPMPLAPGASTTLSVSVPEGFLVQCERVQAAIDTDSALGQYGCDVHQNDTFNLRVRLVSNICLSDTIIIRPRPILGPGRADNADVAVGQVQDAD